MAIVRRRNKAELPEEVPAVRAGINAPKPQQTSLEKFRENLPPSEVIDEIIADPNMYTKKLRTAGVRPRKKKVLGDITYGEVESAIWASEGQITLIARTLRCSVAHVHGIFKRFKLLEQEFHEFRERITDEVEHCLLEKIRAGDTSSMLFYLKCQGKARGYIDRAETGVVSKRGVKMRVVKASAASKKTLKSVGNVVPFVRAAVND